MKKAIIIPTGDEIRNGTVLDINSPVVMEKIISLSPACEVTRLSPVSDDEKSIESAIIEAGESGASLIVLIGGSGGGHRHDKNLSKDFTHSALASLLSSREETLLYGKNGHLWCRLLCGILGENCLVINLPGPHAEAVAAINAFAEVFALSPGDYGAINRSMAQAVRSCFKDQAVSGTQV